MDNGGKIMFYQEVTNNILQSIISQRREGAEEEKKGS